ncbi:FAD binding domain-containing protein [Saccharopolyspora shandongensis]|uniref:FAD binding domain-containing protein n=1 Tax=Saccharopolyspora shandongensis TaxID=418495 RepID=UPI0033F8857A
MKPAEFQYHKPATVADAVRLLHELGDGAKVIAGGQSLLPIMNLRLAEPSHLVDITGISELRGSEVVGSARHYGAATTHMMVEDGLVPDVTGGLLAHAAGGIGYRAIRTRGTLGGSLAHADSSAEWPTVMSAVDAVVTAASVRGTRRIPVRKLLFGFFTTALEPDELITSVEVPAFSPDVRWALHKTARKPGEFAESMAVALRRPTGSELWLGAARDTPVRLGTTETAVHTRPAADIPLAELVEAVAADTHCEGHTLQLHAVTVQRALRAAEREEIHA